jgi:ABC-type nitrate/sulfonate/bicarbonate transport system substrate-binding protein
MHLTFAHYRNRFCMYRTYYALARGIVKPDGFTLDVIELPDPPSHEQEEALIRGDIDAANLYLPNFLRRKLEGAPIIGLCTEWKSTAKGNGVFVRRDGPVRSPEGLAGRVIGTHQGPHAIHRYLLQRRFGIDERRSRWEAHPQEQLLDRLKEGKLDAAVLLDQFFFRGEQDPAVSCLYTDGEVWKSLFGFSEMIKHMIAMREPLWRERPDLKNRLLAAFRASFAYSEEHLDEIAREFLKRYPGDEQALLASARYPRIEFTFTDVEQEITRTEMEMMVEVGWIPRAAPVASLFAM